MTEVFVSYFGQSGSKVSFPKSDERVVKLPIVACQVVEGACREIVLTLQSIVRSKVLSVTELVL